MLKDLQPKSDSSSQDLSKVKVCVSQGYNGLLVVPQIFTLKSLDSYTATLQLSIHSLLFGNFFVHILFIPTIYKPLDYRNVSWNLQHLSWWLLEYKPWSSSKSNIMKYLSWKKCKYRLITCPKHMIYRYTTFYSLTLLLKY